jgi:hypothetical protein
MGKIMILLAAPGKEIYIPHHKDRVPEFQDP